MTTLTPTEPTDEGGLTRQTTMDVFESESHVLFNQYGLEISCKRPIGFGRDHEPSREP